MQQELISTLLEDFQGFFGDTDHVSIVQGPGRVNLIGGHTDYNEGFVLPATIDRAVFAALRPRADKRIHLRSLNFDEEIRFQLGEDVPPNGWSRYAAGIVEELRKRSHLDRGFEGILYGNVPLGAGLSSSAALEVALALGLQTIFSFPMTPEAMAELCQHVEHEYAGVQCGIMDQFASRLGRSMHALFLDCRSLDYEYAPLPLDEASIVIVDSRVSRELAGSKYNERRAECEEAVALLRRHDKAVTALRDVSPEVLQHSQDDLPPVVERRARHVVLENERVLQSKHHLEQQDWSAFGQLMFDSHASLRGLYEVSCPELDFIVDRASETEGVLGARMTGAGFGGCVVALVMASQVASFRDHITASYQEAFDLTPATFVVDRTLEAGQVYPS